MQSGLEASVRIFRFHKSRGTALGGLKIPHGFNNLGKCCWLHTKTGLSQVGNVVISPGPWSTSGPLSRGFSQQACLVSFLGAFWSHGRTNVAEISRFGREVVQHSGLREFHSCALCREIARWELFAKILSLSLGLGLQTQNQ